MSRYIRLLLPLLFLACQSSSEPEFEHVLTGSSTWIESRGGIVAYHHTPASVGYSVRLDYQGSRVRAYRNEHLVAEARFTVREDSTSSSPQPAYIVTYSPALSVFNFTTLDRHTVVFSEGKFRFDEGCCDRYVHTFSHP